MSITFLSDVGTAQLIEQSEDNFNCASSIIEKAYKSDLSAIDEVESFLNEKSVFLDAIHERVQWEQDKKHDQTRFHFVLTHRDDRDDWSASDVRYVRIRLAELVASLSMQLKELKESD